MPGFTIRRKKKVQPTPPQKEAPKAVEAVTETMEEMSLSEESDDSYIEARLNEAKNNARRQSNPQPPRYEPQHQTQRRVHYQHPPNHASHRATPVPQQQQRTPLAHINDPYRRKPTMRVPPKHPMGRKSRNAFRYSSHYGPNGAALGTQQKAVLLYAHCFG